MDCCLKPKFSFPVLPSGAALHRPISIAFRPLIVVAGSGGGLNTPLEPRSAAGRFLSGVLLDDRQKFKVEVRRELLRLGAERDEAVARSQLSRGSDEACLHRRISELKKQESRTAVEEIMYMLILHKFSEMRVHLVPKLSNCVYNGRLEIWPSKDWELESIHTFEALEMVREHISAVIGSRANSKLTDTWTTTEIKKLSLCKIYAASILYGYFLKSASLRHDLEWGPRARECIASGSGFTSEISPYMSQLSAYSSMGKQERRKQEKDSLRCYVMGFDPEMIEMCAKPKSKEAVDLIERHSCALFGDEKTGLLENDELILTSFASLKRFVLEAVAFGCFLWDAENQVSDVYMLEEN